jgi:anti-anti-sigma factor
MENISCWVLKRGSPGWKSDDQKKCAECRYYANMNQHGITVNLDENDSVVIECSGTLNTVRCAVLAKVADKLKKVKKGRVILDLSSVSNIYSCGLSMIVRFHLQCEELGGKLVIVGAAGYVNVAIKTTSIDRFINQVENRSDAHGIIRGVAEKEQIRNQEPEQEQTGDEIGDETSEDIFINE